MPIYIPNGGAIDVSTGWMTVPDTWTYASASTFTVPRDITAEIEIGDKVWLTQTTSKWFVVISKAFSSGSTTVGVTAGSTYTLANAAITLPYYTHVATPVGFPISFDWTVTHGGFSANPTYSASFHTVGRRCYISYVPAAGTSNSSTYTFSLPITAAIISGVEWKLRGGFGTDNGSRPIEPFCFIQSGSQSCTLQLTGGYSSFQATGNKYLTVSGDYPF